MKVAIYCRISTDEQNLEVQERICKEYCNRNNFEIVEIYKDVISGSKASRPAFNRLIQDMRNYKFDCVMVVKLDRLGRSLQHLLSLFDEMSRRGISFIAVTQNIDTTTATGRLQMQVMAAFAEFERSLISERTKEGLKVATGVGKRGKDKKPRKRRGDAKNEQIYSGMEIAKNIPL